MPASSTPSPDGLGATVRAAQRGEPLRGFMRRESSLLEAAVSVDPGGELRDRKRIVDALLRIVEGLYVHLPQKRAMYGKDPVQRLRLLQQRVATVSRRAFHGELAAILTELRDAHTRFIGPADWRGKVALLPFMVELFGPVDAPRCLVSNVVEGDPVFRGTPFGKGVEVLWWNGAPIERAIERYADLETGGRPDARLARARESLTFRPLGYGLTPDEYWVHIGYRTAEPDPRELEIRVDWRVVEVDGPRDGPDLGTARLAFAVDPVAESVRRAKQLLFAPRVWYEHRREDPRRRESLRAAPVGVSPSALASSGASPAPELGAWITGGFQDNVAARIVRTSCGEFGHLRLWSFDLIDDDGFLHEVQVLLDQLPERGLILDLRANPGGFIWAAERLLQLFTPRDIVPTHFSLLATDLTREMAEAPQNAVLLGAWRRSLREAVANGEPYSRALPLTPPSLCNNLGQRYGGPVLCVVDANTYSAGDLFAAGFADHGVGPVVSIGKATGAGGANVWTYSQVRRALAGTTYSLGPLPQGVDLCLSVRRAVRSGGFLGSLIEDVGVQGHFRHQLTRRDLLAGNVDLLERCGKLLASEPATGMTVERRQPARLEVRPHGLDRVDVFLDGHPLVPSLSAVDDPPLSIPLPATWSEAVILGYQGQILRQRRLVQR